MADAAHGAQPVGAGAEFKSPRSLSADNRFEYFACQVRRIQKNLFVVKGMPVLGR